MRGTRRRSVARTVAWQQDGTRYIEMYNSDGRCLSFGSFSAAVVC